MQPKWHRHKETDDKLEPELEPHYRAWKEAPTPETADRMLTAMHPVLQSALRTYAGPSADSPTMMSRAKLMALDAAKTYDPSRAKLGTHVFSALQSLRRVAARSEQAVHIPEGAALSMNRIRNEHARLADELGRDPSDDELASATGLPIKRMTKLRNASGPILTESAFSGAGDEEAHNWTPPVESASLNDKAVETWREAVYRSVDPHAQVIMQHSFGMHGHPVLSNQEIAAKLHLSPGAVSQRRAGIQKQLDVGLNMLGGT